MGLFWDMAVGASVFFFKCRRKLGFWRFIGKGNPPRLWFFWDISVEVACGYFCLGSCGRMGAFSLPLPFPFFASVMAKL